MTIFSNFWERSVEIFMDDFLSNRGLLYKMFEQFRRGSREIMLGHKISSMGLEVDPTKIDVVSK